MKDLQTTGIKVDELKRIIIEDYDGKRADVYLIAKDSFYTFPNQVVKKQEDIAHRTIHFVIELK